MNLNEITLVFDMDGTIADFYGVSNWLDDLENYRVRPYEQAKPLFDIVTINALLRALQTRGVTIAVTSWLSKTGTKDFNYLTRNAKRAWLERYNFPVDEIHLVKYGTRKDLCTKKRGGYQILFDDNEEIRNKWKLGKAVEPENIITELKNLLENFIENT